MPLGRPDTYKPEYCDQMIEHLKEGYSKIAAAGLCGICKTAMWRWEKKHPDFRSAIKRGETLSQIWWEREGKKGMWHGKTFNAAVWIFNMRNRSSAFQNGIGCQLGIQTN